MVWSDRQRMQMATRSWKKQGNKFFSFSLRKEPALSTPWLQPSGTDFRLLTSRTSREVIVFFLSHWVCGNLWQQPRETNSGSKMTKQLSGLPLGPYWESWRQHVLAVKPGQDRQQPSLSFVIYTTIFKKMTTGSLILGMLWELIDCESKVFSPGLSPK